MNLQKERRWRKFCAHPPPEPVVSHNERAATTDIPKGTRMFEPKFLLTSLIVVLIPGTGAVYTITTGITLKWRASLAAAIGCTLGIVPHIAASILGLSALLNMSAQVFSVLKLAGSAYLLYIAWNMWREAGKLELNRN